LTQTTVKTHFEGSEEYFFIKNIGRALFNNCLNLRPFNSDFFVEVSKDDVGAKIKGMEADEF
jgi:hypothetical protein